ncbi:hypothetical protein BDV93DRAFT_230477 [Ceratobasidium sp. AG-I]|nr:hypothetical protein BDV93DRAFT_230477 [Ceratobasidium sp. AG-I]
MVFKPNKHTNPSQKPSKNTRRPTISKPASPPCPNTSTSSSETPSPERPIVSQENMRCELEVGFETETSRVVFVDHRENLDKPEWIEPVGKALESQMPGQLVKVGRRFSRDSGAFSIASHEHYERYDEIEPDN